jgi:hypothetical protein
MSCFIKDCFLKPPITAKEHYFALKVRITTKKESHMEVKEDIRPGGYKKEAGIGELAKVYLYAVSHPERGYK